MKMTEWFAANWGTILTAGIIVLVVILVIRVLIKDKKAGRSGCAAGCAGCAMKGACCRQHETGKSSSGKRE